MFGDKRRGRRGVVGGPGAKGIDLWNADGMAGCQQEQQQLGHSYHRTSFLNWGHC